MFDCCLASCRPFEVPKYDKVFQLLLAFLGGIYCYANFYCYSIVFGPNFREGQKFSREGGKLPQGGALCPLWEKARLR